MANSDFDRFVKIGSRNGGNGRLVDVLLRSKRLPFAVTPELVWERQITFRDFQTHGERTQTATITVGGTPDDGDYTITFATPTPDVDAVYTADVSIGGDTNDDIAAGLAAAITTLIATSLDGIVASATSNTADVIIVFEPGISAQEFLLDQPVGATLADVSSFATSLDLDALVEGDSFPDDVCRGLLMVHVDEAFNTTAADLAVGDDAPDVLMAAGDLTATGYVEDRTATQRGERFESSFAPTATLTTGEQDVSELSEGRLRLWLGFCPPPAIP